jgi:hypothetical protein
MNILNRMLHAACLICLIFAVTSCTLERRKDLAIDGYSQPLALSNTEDLKVIFEEVIPGKPLNETVWDNAHGPFWDVKESKQIGFTQDYSKFVPLAATAGLIGGAIGGAVAGAAAGPQLVDTRIVIPFGNVFSGTFESAIAANIKQHLTCFNSSCAAQAFPDNVLSIAIDNFYVWEGPLNHLNFYVKGRSLFTKKGSEVRKYDFEKSMLSQQLGTIMSTHSSFLKEMNRLSNLFAQQVTTDIITNTIK